MSGIMLDVDPIEDPNFHPMRKREANPDTIKRIERLAKIYHTLGEQTDLAKDDLAAAIREAKAAGHSFPQLAEAAGVSIGVIQRMVEQ